MVSHALGTKPTRPCALDNNPNKKNITLLSQTVLASHLEIVGWEAGYAGYSRGYPISSSYKVLLFTCTSATTPMTVLAMSYYCIKDDTGWAVLRPR
jgi:hypothetical protein